MKPGIPKGTRDFGPTEVKKRNYIFNIIKNVFTKYGFDSIETPVMENLQTLTGKYGEEGDKLLFKVLNNGDYLAKADSKALEERNSGKLTSSISKRGMRYDLTVPFARFVVMHQNDLAFPFKRYQIQPVWRADRPAKGRYQEFYQCDVDVIGSKSLMYEAELCFIYDEIFEALGLDVEIRINNRKILAGLAAYAGIEDKFQDMTVAIDKLDKIGEDGVIKEMTNRGIPQEAATIVLNLIAQKDLDKFEETLSGQELAMEGLAEIKKVYKYLSSKQMKNAVVFDPCLARGLNYYTGAIFEVVGLNVNMGSLGGGGRYADLTSIFGLKDMSGVGVSLGAERIYDVMLEKELFPTDLDNGLELLLIAMDEDAHDFAFANLGQIREAGITAELYPEPAKMKKQMKYANARQARYTAIIGSEELKNKQFTLKNMESGEQELVDINGLIKTLS
jgi:histidyl-tRNA synthetase